MSTLRVLEVFETLCDRPRAEQQEELARLPAELRDAVDAMLRADHVDLDVSMVQWGLAADLTGPTADLPREVPETLGAYRILQPLGEGGMGSVFIAEQAHPRRRVALKVLHARGATQAALAEAQALVDVRHDSIPHVIEAGEQDGFAYLVMELVHGQPLHTWCQSASLADAVRVLGQICRGVHAAHDAGVLHRDIKPSNIVVSTDGRPVLLDFGLAAGMESTTGGGTLAYLSPERLRNEPATVASDVFALGVTLYEVLAGTRPYPAATHPSRRAEQKSRRAVPVRLSSRGLGSRDLDAIIAKALAPAETRYGDAAALADDLDALLEHRPVVAAPAGVVRRMRMWLRRQGRGVAIAGGTALLVVGVVAVAYAVSVVQSHRRADAEDREAGRRLSVLETTLEPFYAREAWSDISQALQAFTADPVVLRTSWPSVAWLHHHHRLIEAGEVEEGRKVLARAFLASNSEETRRRVRGAIASLLRSQQDWRALLRVLADGTDLEDAGEWQTQARIAVRELPAADELDAMWVPLLERLSQAHRTPYRPISVTVNGSGSDARLLILEQDAGLMVVARPTPDLAGESTPLPGLTFGYSNPKVVSAQDPLVVGPTDAGLHELGVWSLGDGLAEPTKVESGGAFLGGATQADVDGDGAPELFVGTVFPERGLYRVTPGGRVAALPQGHKVHSDVGGMFAWDLDRDGDDELILTTGLWSGFDTRVYDQVDGSLKLVDRLRYNGIPILAPGTGGTVVSAAALGAGSDVMDRRGALGPGVYVHAWRGDGLELIEHVDFEPQVEEAGAVAVAHVDVDGDGQPELLVTVSSRSGPHLYIYRKDGLGVWQSVQLAGANLMATAQLDDDPEQELLIRLRDDDYHLWVVGAGDEVMPPWRPARAMDGSASLAAYGFELEEADALLRRAENHNQPDRIAQDLADAGVLLLGNQRYSDASRSLAQASSLVEAPPPWSKARREAEQLAHLDTAPSHVLDLTAPSPYLRILQPGALRWSPGEGLDLDAIDLDDLLFEVPLDVVGGELGMEIDLEVSSMEAAVSVRAELVAPSGEVVGTLGVEGWGGGRTLGRIASCFAAESFDHVRDYTPRRTVDAYDTQHVLRVDVRRGERYCEIRREGSFSADRRWRAEPVVAGRYRLRVSAGSTLDSEHRSDWSCARLKTRVKSIRLWGATPVEVHNEAWVEEWTQGLYASALSGAVGPDARMELLMALRELDLAKNLLMEEELDDRVILGGLKREPVIWLALLRDAQWESFGDDYARAWADTMSSHRGESVLDAVDHPFVDELEPSTELLAGLLLHRGRVLEYRGLHTRALRLYRRLVDAPLRRAERVELLLDLAARAHGAGELEEAAEYCREANGLGLPTRVADRRLDRPGVGLACAGLEW